MSALGFSGLTGGLSPLCTSYSIFAFPTNDLAHHTKLAQYLLMDSWSTHPALADDDGPRTPLILPTSPRETMNFNDRVSNFLQSRPPIITASVVDAISRPSSALSGTSSFADGSVTDFGANSSSKWQFAGATARDERQCLLCGAPYPDQIPVTSRLEERHNQAVRSNTFHST